MSLPVLSLAVSGAAASVVASLVTDRVFTRPQARGRSTSRSRSCSRSSSHSSHSSHSHSRSRGRSRPRSPPRALSPSRPSKKPTSFSLSSLASSASPLVVITADGFLFFLLYGYIRAARASMLSTASTTSSASSASTASTATTPARSASNAINAFLAGTAAAACARAFSTALTDEETSGFPRYRHSATDDLARALDPGLTFLLQQVLGQAAERSPWLQRQWRRRRQQQHVRRYKGAVAAALDVAWDAALDTSIVFVLAAVSKGVATAVTYPLRGRMLDEDEREALSEDEMDEEEEEEEEETIMADERSETLWEAKVAAERTETERTEIERKMKEVVEEVKAKHDAEAKAVVGAEQEAQEASVDTAKEEAETNEAKEAKEEPAEPTEPTEPVPDKTALLYQSTASQTVLEDVPATTQKTSPSRDISEARKARMAEKARARTAAKPARPLLALLPRIIVQAALRHGLTMAGQRVLYGVILRLAYLVAGALARLVGGRRQAETAVVKRQTKAAMAEQKVISHQQQQQQQQLEEKEQFEQQFFRQQQPTETTEEQVQVPVQVPVQMPLEEQSALLAPRTDDYEQHASDEHRPGVSAREVDMRRHMQPIHASIAQSREAGYLEERLLPAAAATDAADDRSVAATSTTTSSSTVSRLHEALPSAVSSSVAPDMTVALREPSLPPQMDVDMGAAAAAATAAATTPTMAGPLPPPSETMLTEAVRVPEQPSLPLIHESLPELKVQPAAALAAVQPPVQPPVSSVSAPSRYVAPPPPMSVPIDRSLQEDMADRLRGWSAHNADYYAYDDDDYEGTVIYNMISRTQRFVR